MEVNSVVVVGWFRSVLRMCVVGDLFVFVVTGVLICLVLRCVLL